MCIGVTVCLRVAGLCAAADAMKRLGLSRRPMSAYFELYQRISERSESMTPWGFPPIFQFEERMALEDRLKFFSRANKEALDKKANGRNPYAIHARHGRFANHRIYWIPLTWKFAKKWQGPGLTALPGVMAD